jgi:hypothetical protein
VRMVGDLFHAPEGQTIVGAYTVRRPAVMCIGALAFTSVPSGFSSAAALPSTACAGTSTVGSSEGCMLGGLAMKLRWRQRRQAAGKPADKPNIVMGSNVQASREWHW